MSSEAVDVIAAALREHAMWDEDSAGAVICRCRRGSTLAWTSVDTHAEHQAQQVLKALGGLKTESKFTYFGTRHTEAARWVSSWAEVNPDA